jgi:hypothetical protein
MKRTLTDFGALSPAEETLRDEICGGQIVVLGDGARPGEAAGPDRQVRATFLRYLILGGCDALPGMIPEHGVNVVGALVTGELNLKGARIPRDVVLLFCRFDTIPNFMSAQLDTLNLSGSALPGLDADGLQAGGSVSLSNVEATGEILLTGARLGGDLDCECARFTAGKSGRALVADGLQVGGIVSLSGAKAIGEMRLLGARLGGNLDCSGARFTAGKSGKALNADGLRAGGGVFLIGAEATGEVRFLGAKLGVNLSCSGASFTAGKSGKALNVDGAEIDGVFFLREKARVEGVLDLTGARVGSLCDDPDCWPKPGNLILNRCRYGAFVGQSPVTAAARMRWLDLQYPAQWNEDFWPQPWEQCAKVLREMGHADDARQVLIGKERGQRKWRRDRLKARLVGARLRLRLERLDREDPEALSADIQSAEQDHKGPMRREVTAQLDQATYVRERNLAELVKDRAAFDAELARGMARSDVAGFDPALNARGAVLETQVKLASSRFVDAVLSASIAYGHRPLRALGWLAGLWLFGALLFGIAAGQGAFKPNNAFVLRRAEWVDCAPQTGTRNTGTSQLACFRDQPEAASYPAFNAWIYSADTLLPIVALEMQEFWIPDETQGTRGQATRVFLWLQIMAGWALSLLAVAGFSGLVRSD